MSPSPTASRRAAVLLVLAGITGCGSAGEPPRSTPAAAAVRAVPEGAPAVIPAPGALELPGLGPSTLAEIPAGTRQVLLVTGEDVDSSESAAVLYRRTAAGWEPGDTWPAHNALRGWTDDHRLGDLRSPVGVFTLTDAGGRLENPGTDLPYDRGPAFTISGTGFEGEPLAGSFDYVVAVNYNRVPGTTPLDWTRPLGEGKGGGIWVHVDHDGPTQGCVSLEKEHMAALLRALEPQARPVVVMGDPDSLAE